MMAQLPGTMKAGVATPDGLEVRSVPTPSPGPTQVLVRVRAAGMNRADLNAAKGAGVATADAFGKPIGMEWAGDVVQTGKDVHTFQIGDSVMCSGAGGYAEFAVAEARRTIRLADGAPTFEEAAALPLALLTAHDAVVTHGQVATGDAVLIQGGSSAVGLMASQIAKYFGAGLVIGTSSHAIRRAKLKDFGTDRVVDCNDEHWIQQVMDATDGKGVNVIVDMVSGKTVSGSMRAAAVRARMVNVGRLGGTVGEFDFDLHAAKRIDYRGVTFRTRTPDEVFEIVKRATDDLLPAVYSRKISLPIAKIFDLSDAKEAHEYMRTNLHFGKIVLIP
ncbi:zinc-binding dehydrogenase [Paraburkholderia sp. LEh10]|uniref:zinc-binding dehydrogenase n=1 Tax=Paraburkholderia sp. LEh10 TaxID=2821353 RepID=UPI001AEAECC0|nr:zinc-binding dehydrogenase [Paraburkholderia sp. LEh10]MBP0590450.1 zinc-binding dehydrogenase [Paraburkholderia sp. LEh10]